MTNNSISITINGLQVSGNVNDVMAIIAAMSGNAQAGATAKKEVRTDYENKNRGFDNVALQVEKDTLRFTHSDGSYLNEGFIRKALNARAKAAGAVWDKEGKVWRFSSAQKVTAFKKGFSLEGLDAEVDAIIAATNDRNRKRNEKNA